MGRRSRRRIAEAAARKRGDSRGKRTPASEQPAASKKVQASRPRGEREVASGGRSAESRAKGAPAASAAEQRRGGGRAQADGRSSAAGRGSGAAARRGGPPPRSGGQLATGSRRSSAAGRSAAAGSPTGPPPTAGRAHIGASLLTRRRDAPDPPWAPFPLVELAILTALVLLVVGFLTGGSRGGVMLACGLGLASVASLELTLREHFAGYRSHASLLAGAGAVGVAVLLYAFSGLTQPLPLVITVGAFGTLWSLLRAAYRRGTRR